MSEKKPVVVIVGGGFGGIAAARALKDEPVEVVLIDRTNHHLFQPLLYQVATSILSPGQIGVPIRSILQNQKNATVIMGTVTGIDVEAKHILADNEDQKNVLLPYDYLILATGVTHSYFGHDEYAKYAPGLKTLSDAVSIRNKILTAFEVAEAEEDPSAHPELLTFVLVGGGPTGVEMASAISVLIQSTLKKNFRRVDPRSARILLLDRGERPLASFPPELSEAARKRLERLGVDVRMGANVDSIDEHGVVVNGERIEARMVIWTAGVAPSPAGKWLKTETDRSGRVRINSDLSVKDHPEIFVVGDTASLDQDGKPLPGVAQVALQQGHYAGNLIGRRVAGKQMPAPFKYFDKGNLAVVGKGFAVLQSGKLCLSGGIAWLAWVGVHLLFLAQKGQRLSVLGQWLWTYFTGQRGSRVIVKHHCD